MILNVEYLDNNIVFSDGYVNALEIENKDYFCRLINDINQLNNGDFSNNIHFIENKKEINMNNKVILYIDLFNIEINNKKIITHLYKKINEIMTDESKNKIIKSLEKIEKEICDSMQDFDFSININNNINLDDIFKLFKISITEKDNMLDNIMLIMEINKIFNLDLLLIFVNLKLYLSKEQVREIYKYSLYNNQKILLIDSLTYGIADKYEKKLLIDNDLIEFVL